MAKLDLYHIVIITLVVAAVIALGWFAKRKWYDSAVASYQPLLRSFRFGGYCFPCASPIDAQFGTTLFIAGHATLPGAQRRFVFYNNSGQTMTVRSFCFGGYDRKYRGSVTEMINPTLMSKYGYTNVVPAGGVFSLDASNDQHVMYKGWYNAPIFIAYTLGAEGPNSTYEIVGWAPMRLQDETVKYKYFYDSNLKDRVKSDMKGKQKVCGALDCKDIIKVMDKKEEFTLARNAAIHWKTGSGVGGAAPLSTVSGDKNSQCYWVTELNTFDAVNVHVPLCHVSVKFVVDTDYLRDMDNRATCLRRIAEVASSKVMDSAADLDNFVHPPDFNVAGFLADAVGLTVWFYVKVSQIVAETIAAAINVVMPGLGSAISDYITVYYIVLQVMFYTGGKVLKHVPGVGTELSQAAMVMAGFGEGTAGTIQTIADPILGVVSAAAAAAAGNALESTKVILEESAKAAVKSIATAAALEAAQQAGKTAAQWAYQVVDDAVRGVYDQMDSLIVQMVLQSSLLPEAAFRGKGKDDWEVGRSGRDGYALDRKLWVNRELKKGKFSQDARCSGAWELTYHD